jgi:hypothetical protein
MCYFRILYISDTDGKDFPDTAEGLRFPLETPTITKQDAPPFS